MLALFAVAGGAAVWSFVWPDEDPWILVGSIEDFPPSTVTTFGYVDEPLAFHVVRLSDGKIIALRARSTHRGQALPYRPDLVYAGRPGWFRDPLHGTTFDLAGRRAFGPAVRDLDRLAIEVRNSAVFVNPTAITRGADAIFPYSASLPASAPPPATPGPPRRADGYEFQTGGTLLPQRWLPRETD